MDFKVLCFAIFVAQVAAIPTGEDFEGKYSLLKTNLQDTIQSVLTNYNNEAERREEELANADWNYKTNMNTQNLKKKINVALQFKDFDQQTNNQAKSFKDLAAGFNSESRQFKLHERPSTIQLEDDDMVQYYQLIDRMNQKLSSATVCKDLSCGLHLYPELETEFRKVKDEDQLRRMWVAFRKNTGQQLRADFEDLVRKSNRGAQKAGYKDMGQMYRAPYESPNLKGEVKQVWNEVQPLYKNIHAYVRSQLRKFYGEDTVSAKGAIPAHLLGDMYAEDWSNVFNLVEPFPKPATPEEESLGTDQREFEVNANMHKQDYTARRTYELADNSFKSMAFENVPDSFWKNSLFVHSYDKESMCNVETFETFNPKDVRLTDCRNPSFRQYMDAYRQMGKLQYAMQYKDQPTVFREAATPAFKEAVGETLALSAATPQHLREQNLIGAASNPEEEEINFLFLQALYTIPRMAFSNMLENYRYNIFEGKTNFDNLNCAYVNDRYTVQGVAPAVKRSEDDFDAGSYKEIITNEETTRNFMSQVLKFQFHESLCTEAGQYTPSEKIGLHKCSLFNSAPAGAKLAKMMAQGSSKTPKEIMKEFTGKENVSSEALLTYFKPLNDWLEKENAKNAEFVGWEKDATEEICIKESVDPKLRSAIQCTFIRTENGVECA